MKRIYVDLLVFLTYFLFVAKRFRVWTVAEIKAVRYPGSTELPLKGYDSQPSSPPLAISGVSHRKLFISSNIFKIHNQN